MSEFENDQEGPDVAVAEPIVRPRKVAEPKEDTKAEQSESTQTGKLPPYHVIIVNDEEHTFDYVIELLCKLFGHGLTKSKELTWRIHTTGRAVVYTTHKERAELKRDQVLSYGPDPRMSISKGSLQCYIEPAPAD